MPESPQELSFQGKSLVITNHALEMFQKRWREVYPTPIKKWRVLPILHKLLASAKPDETLPPEYRVRRIINNNFTIAEYWENSGWRFVIVQENEEIPTLVTVERAYQRLKDQ